MKFLQLIKKGATAPTPEEGVLYYDKNTESTSVIIPNPIVSTTYEVKNISVTETQPMEASSTSATVTFTGVKTETYKKGNTVVTETEESQTVEFEANDTTEAATRNGSFEWNGESVAWSVNLKAKEDTPTVELVDLGLPSGLKWATCNIGATKPEEYGLYFQWGATEGYTGDEALAHSDWPTAPFNNGSSSYNSTYFASVSGDVLTTKEGETYSVLKSQYDAATATYGEGYRMPTEAEMNELTANTTSAWTQVNGVKCLKLTSKSDTSKSIIFPAAGYCSGGSFYRVGSYSNVWTSSLFPNGGYLAWYLYFDYGVVGMNGNSRYQGFSVRAVHE